MSNVPETYPISGLCIVANPEKCPPGYELLYRSHDKRDDCDLWKDSFFKARVTRYLCYTRIFPLDGGRLNNVMVDIAIQNTGEYPPSGFTLIEKTIDTGEKASRKKQLCVKLVPRDSTKDAISELIILSRSKRPPSGYTMVGEVNGLIFCFKTNPVPTDTQNSPPQAVTASHEQTSSESAAPTAHVMSDSYDHYSQWSQAPAMLGSSPPSWTNSYRDSNTASTMGTLARSMYSHRVEESHVPNNIQESINNAPISGVPFQLSPHLTSSTSANQTPAPEISYRSLVDLNSEYNYSFRLERQATNQEIPGL